MNKGLDERKSVMIVEDVAVTAIALSDALEDAGYEVPAHCSSAAEALALLTRITPDFAILDLTLRGSSCVDVARVLRRRGVPFIIHSGWAPLPPLAEELEGAPWLEKPVSFDTLVQALRALETQSAQQEASGVETRQPA